MTRKFTQSILDTKGTKIDAWNRMRDYGVNVKNYMYRPFIARTFLDGSQIIKTTTNYDSSTQFKSNTYVGFNYIKDVSSPDDLIYCTHAPYIALDGFPFIKYEESFKEYRHWIVEPIEIQRHNTSYPIIGCNRVLVKRIVSKRELDMWRKYMSRNFDAIDAKLQ
jgi:hypothetical protein